MSRSIQLRHVPDCPNVDRARRLIDECVRELGDDIAVVEVEGAYPSPSIIVDGHDVMGDPGFEGAGCRLDVPTRDRLLAALRRE